jgi:flavin reductase (DIM6/NTAB) family NADH-FMN oxidoreductase RutF
MDATAASTLIAWLDPTVWLVTAAAGECRGAMVATFVNNASLVPDLPRMVLGLAKQHHTWQLVEASGAFGLHLITEQDIDLVYRFGLKSGRDEDKLAGLEMQTGSTGSPLLKRGVGWFDCKVETKMDTGDRTIYLAEVVESQVVHFAAPLTMRRLIELAPPHIVTELKRQRHHDSLVDAEAIRVWRQNNQPRINTEETRKEFKSSEP